MNRVIMMLLLMSMFFCANEKETYQVIEDEPCRRTIYIDDRPQYVETMWYDEEGRLSVVDHDSGADGEVEYSTRYEYDEGRLVMITIYGQEGEIEQTERIDYCDGGIR